MDKGTRRGGRPDSPTSALLGVALVLAVVVGVRAGSLREPFTPLAPPSASARQAPQRQVVQTPAPTFETAVQPVLEKTCSRCHNALKPTSGFNAAAYTNAETLLSDRDGWEIIVGRLEAGEMPPAGEEGPTDDEAAAFVDFVQRQFEIADRNTTPDPGRVTAHRLNRVEYANTVRDLLGVDFEAEEFAADDSGYGFDNNGDVLTVSPALMQQYLTAAERIASRAVGGAPLPDPGIFTRRDRVRRSGDAIELTHVFDYDAEYSIRIAITGHRGLEDPPVTLAISVDGKEIRTDTIPVQLSAVNKQGGGTQRAVREARVFLTGNRHVIRAGFVNDEGLQKIPEKSRRAANMNIFPEFIEVSGPYRPAAPPPVTKKVLICDPAAGASCVTRIASTFARRAYRRPVTRAEVAQLTRVFDKAKAAGYDPAQSVQFMLSAMLVSPHFLFRVERDPGPGKVSRITDHELASRLSYFLWSSMPDDELLALAGGNKLRQPAVLQAQVKRLLADPRSAALADNFAGQWLETRSLDAVRRDAAKFPEWNAELRESMKEETRRFFDAILRENRPVSDFIDGRFTFLNERLAKHYGIAGVTGAEFRRVDLTTPERGGVFTHGSVLTVSSYPTRTSPVLRGKYLLENVLNYPVPPPPPDIPTLDEAEIGVARSLRGQLEQHRSDTFCASCHNKMDPLGFGMENYDAIGRWRTQDGTFNVDSSGTLPSGHSFNGPAELKQLMLTAMPEFTRGLATRMLTYALGRGVESYDRLAVKAIVADTAAGEYRLQAMIQGIVKSAPFQQRRGEKVAKSPERITN
jgi:mono/diheme cytochrome c family protein